VHHLFGLSIEVAAEVEEGLGKVLHLLEGGGDREDLAEVVLEASKLELDELGGAVGGDDEIEPLR